MILVFWTAIFILMYTFILYPIIIYFVARFLVKPSLEGNSDALPTVDIIIVVRNAEDLIARKLNSLKQLDYPTDKIKIIFVSDKSTDRTAEVIKTYVCSSIILFNNDVKSSKSACLNQAIAKSESELIFLTDIRQEVDSKCLLNLVSHFNDYSIGAVSGELMLKPTNDDDFGQSMDAYWRYEKFIRFNEGIVDSVPGVTGAVYMLRREYYEPIPNETLLDDVLIPMNLIFRGKRVLFEPDAIAYDEPSDDIARERIRKIRTISGNWQLFEIAPYLFNPFRNRIWIQFISHKILRLFSPFLLLLILVINFLLASYDNYYFFIFCIQSALYLIVAGSFYFKPLTRIPLIGIARSFISLMYFTLLGFVYFLTRRHLFIWK